MSAAYLKRYEAVFLCIHPKGPKMSITGAARYMHKSEGFVRMWVERYKASKTVDDLPGRGSQRTTTIKQDKAIIALFKRKPQYTLREGQYELQKKHINVSITTIRNRLRESGIGYRSTLMKPLLSDRHRAARRGWANNNGHRDWSDVVFTDEASFYAWSHTKRAWSTRQDRVIQRTVKHPVKVHVWGCFNARGFGSLCVFTENLNAERMVKLYQKGLIPSVRKWFGDNNNQWILQEDNDPKHRSRRCTEWKLLNGISTLEWPSQSPDANPIENVWAIMKQKLQRKRTYTIKQLSRNLRQIWRSLSTTYAENLVASMERRCQAIIDNDGDWTPY